MKHTLIPLLTIAALWAAGCRETETPFPDVPPAREAGRTVNVRVGLSAADTSAVTKSVATPGVENFTEAYLFAFWADGADAGEPCTVNGAPAAVYTTGKTFDWTLPAGAPIEVLAVVNAVEDVKRELDRWAYGFSRYSKDDLLALRYTCASASDLIDLEYREYNMPMTGMVTVTLDPENPALSIPVKRLFAKFDITLDVSGWADEGWTVTAASVTGARSNTEVPYFYTGTDNGFRQTDSAKFASVDSSTSEDLADLNFRDAAGRSRAVTYYFLENCQRVQESAGRWSSVAMDLGSRVDNCSYLRINVSATKPGYGQRRFGYRIYLDSAEGSEMKTGFNIIRNTSRSIVLKLGAPQDGFEWTNTNKLSIAPGESVTIPFETSLTGPEIVTSCLRGGAVTGDLYLASDIEWQGDNPSGRTAYPFSGSATFTAVSSAAEGLVVAAGGSTDGNIRDEVSVEIATPLVLTVSVPSRRIQFERFTLTTELSRTDHLKLLRQIDPSRDWDAIYAGNPNQIYSASNLQLVTGSLGIRTSGGSAPAYFEGVKLTGISARPSPLPNPTKLTLSFTLLNTESHSRVQKVDILNTVLGNSLSENIDVTATSSLMVRAITGTSAPYVNNGASGEVDHHYGSAIYDIDIRGYQGVVYFEPYAIYEGAGVKPAVEASDLDGYGLDMVSGHYWHLTELDGDFLNLDYDGEDVETVLSGTTVNYFKWTYALCDYDSLSIGYWMYYSKMYDVKLQRQSVNQFLSSDGFMLRLSNPRNDWWNITSEQDYDHIDCHFSITVDGNAGTPCRSANFGGHYVSYPYREGVGWPAILPCPTVGTGTGGYPPSTLFANGINIYDTIGIEVANDLHNYGTLKIGVILENVNSSETLEAIWAYVDVVREFTIYAGYQYVQKNYLTSITTPFSNGNFSRFIPYLYAPSLDEIMGSGTLTSIVSTDATSANGINAVNPSEEFYKATNTAEHWFHSLTSSYTQLWDCESGVSDRACLLQNKVIVYDSPKKVTANGEYSWYELQYAGPIVSSRINFGLGHHGHHSDFVYSMRNVAVWNRPQFRFNGGVTVNGETSEVVSDYLTLGKYARVRFDWKKNVAALSPINQYDTRYIVYRTFEYSGGWLYFGSNMGGSSSMRTAYYDPRRTQQEYLKLYDPTKPYYRVAWDSYDDDYMTISASDIHDALGGSVSGSYRDENVIDSHRMNRAFGVSDSFWLPGNLIP
ncbi:MAG: DUF4906 domain-containing protein [Bacteroidales bacterium]|nr:DUF4906 domain-containing protein [Bacteroidales bacterium]